MSKIREFGLFLCYIILFHTNSAFAQNPGSFYVDEPRTFEAGLIAGTNFSQVDGDRFAGYHKVGLNIGGIVYAHLAPNLAASIELLYSEKGSRSNKANISVSGTYSINDMKINLRYAEIPIMLNYFDKRKSNFGGGLSYSYIITAEELISTEPTYVPAEKYPFNKSDLQLVLGGNLLLYKGLFLNLRFQYSLINVRKKYDPEMGRSEQFNNLWTLRLMYLF